MSGHRPEHRDPAQIGPYRILDRIGEGGMGIVYRAAQQEPVRRTVALKVIKLGMDTREVVARFQAERQALALMDHPNIAKVVDAGATEAGRPYFVMELVRGVPITEYCDAHSLDTRDRLELFIPVCLAVQHAHQKGIIHRDLKPSNILIATIDGKPTPKVIDFGIAKAVRQGAMGRTQYTQAGVLLGTPEYMSPEQAQTGGADVDTRADIYSLGVILYELLTGMLPFDPQTLREAGADGVARIIRDTVPSRPSVRLSQARKTIVTSEASPATALDRDTSRAASTQRRPDRARSQFREVKGDLDWIVLKAIEKDRSRRYDSAAFLSADIRRHLASEPVLARPPSRAYQVNRFIRRHQVAVASAASVVLALVLGIIGTSVEMVRARHAQANSDRAEQSVALERDHLVEAQAQILAQVRHSIAATTARVNAMIASGQAANAASIARDNLETARQTLKPGDPVTWDAIDALARAQFVSGDSTGAQGVLQQLIDEVGSKPLALRGIHFGDYLNHLAQVREKEAAPEELESLWRRAIEAYDAAGGAQNGLERGRTAARLAQLLSDRSKLPDAAAFYGRALADARVNPGITSPEARRIVDGYVAVLQRTARYPEALSLLDEQRQLTQARHPEDSDEGASYLAQVARVLLLSGNRPAAAARISEAIAMRSRIHGTRDAMLQAMWRDWTLLNGLSPAPAHWTNERLRGELWVTATELLAAEPSSSLGTDEIKWDQMHFELRRWDGQSAPLVSQGNLAQLRTLKEPPPGLYVIGIALPKTDGTQLRQATWFLNAPWKVAAFDIPPSLRDRVVNDAPWPDRDLRAWGELTKAPLQGNAGSMASVFIANCERHAYYGTIHVGGGPGGAVSRFGMVAETTIELPPGVYAISSICEDGFRLTIDGRPAAEAWQTRNVAHSASEVCIGPGPHTLRVEYFHGLGSSVFFLSPVPIERPAERLMAHLLEPDATQMHSWLLCAGTLLERAGELEVAGAYLERAAHLSDIDPALHAASQAAWARVLEKTDKAADAADALEQQVDALRTASLADPNAAADAALQLGQAQMAAGQPDRAAQSLSRATHLFREAHPSLGPEERERLRRALLCRLGCGQQAPDGSLSAQVWCAVDEMLTDDLPRRPDPAELTPQSVRYHIVRWTDGKEAFVANGDLASLAALPSDAPAGLYLIELDVNAGAFSTCQTRWAYVGRWNVSLYCPPTNSGHSPLGWQLAQDAGCVCKFERASLAFMNAMAASPVPWKRDDGFALVAQTTVRLPRGRYRLSVTADDGVWVWLDGRRVIDAWVRQMPRWEHADVLLDDDGCGRPHDLKVAYCQRDNGYKLWFRIEPLDDQAAQSLARSMGCHGSRSLERALVEEGEAIGYDQFNYAAQASLGALNAQLGHLSVADACYEKADLDASNIFAMQQRAVLAICMNQRGMYAKRRAALLKDVHDEGDESDAVTAARTAIVSMLAPLEGAAERKAIDQLLARARADASHAPSAASLGKVAAGLLELQSQHPDAAMELLSQAVGSPDLSPSARAVAQLALAIAFQRQGCLTPAHQMLTQAQNTFGHLPNPSETELDAAEVQDRLIYSYLQRDKDIPPDHGPRSAPALETARGK